MRARRRDNAYRICRWTPAGLQAQANGSPHRAERDMDVRLPALTLLLASGGLVAPCLRAEEPFPPLQLQGGDFPELLIRIDADGAAVPDCDHIRARRIDELEPRWRQAVERIELDCEDVGQEMPDLGSVVTVATAFLKPHTAQFAQVPVSEVRMMDSERWGDHQYLLAAPFTHIRKAVRERIEAVCTSQHEAGDEGNDVDAVGSRGCGIRDSREALYLDNGNLGGTWVHAAEDDPQQTIYAEAWAD